MAGYYDDLDKLISKMESGSLRLWRTQTKSDGQRLLQPGADFKLVERVVNFPPLLLGDYQLLPDMALIKAVNEAHRLDWHLENVRLPNYKALYDVIDGKPLYEKVEAYLADFQTRRATPQHQKRLANAKQTAERRVRAMTGVINHAFRYCRRLVICRLDLFYKHRFRHQKSLATLESDRRRLLNNLRHHHLFDGLLHDISKLEFGDKKGFHLHLMLLFDGDVVLRATHRAEAIGQYWQSLTDGEGSYYTTNRESAKKMLAKWLGIPPENLALGRITREDKQKLLQLQAVVQYFSKLAQSLRASSVKRHRQLRITRGNRIRQLEAIRQPLTMEDVLP